MRRIFAWILALAVLFSGCARTEEAGPGIPSGAETSSEAESPSGADLPPEVTGPDENGFFPAISSEDFDRWVTNGAPDTEKPAEAVTPFLKMKACLDYLDQTFPGITDWRVLYEEDRYLYRTGTYDPYTYSWRDQWMPYRFVVLGTEQSGACDRAAFVCIDEYIVTSGVDGKFYPQKSPLIYHCHGWESELRFGTEEDYARAQSVFRLETDFYPSLVNSETGRTLLLDFWLRNEIIPVREIPEGFGHTIFYVEKLKTYGLNGVPDDRIVYLYRDNDWDDRIDVAYYDVSAEELHPLAYGGSRIYSPQFFMLNAGCFAMISGEADEMFLYHTEAETPWEPAAVLGRNGKGLSDGGVYIPNLSLTLTDKKDPVLHVLPYINLEEQILYFCTFRDDGSVVTNLSTGLHALEEGWYLDFQNFTDGIVYFLYYPDGGAYGGTHLAMNLRSGKSHALQIWKGASPAACTAEGGLNLRSGPGADYEKLAVIPENAKVILFREQDGWSYVAYGETVGWASSEYLDAGEHG